MPRPRRRASRSSAPPELRLAYGARARPLGRAVLSLLPPPPPPGGPCPTCYSSAGCLACRRWAHLLREGDPIAYRRLVTRAFCAIPRSAAAPPPPQYTLGNGGHSQAKLVRETIKSIMKDRSGTTKNVLCVGCREDGQSRCVSDLVSSTSWNILLHRIGDLLMCYILRHSSIFLSVKKNDYFQVSGLPLNGVLHNPIFVSDMARDEQPCSKEEKCSMCYLWCKQEQAPKLSGGSCVNNSNVGFYSIDATTCKFDALPSFGKCGAARITEPTCSPDACNYSIFHSINESTICSSLCGQKPTKRKRLYRWQRCNKKICCEDKSAMVRSKVDNSNAGAEVSDEVHFLDPTGATYSLQMSSGINYPQTNEPYGVHVLPIEMSPSSVFDMKPSQYPGDHSTSRCQPTCPLLGPPSFLHLNVVNNVANNGRNLDYSVGGKSSSFDQSFSLLEAYSTPQQVVSFIWAVLTRIVPDPLLGNSNSKRFLRINIWKFIELRRFETFHLCDCIRELKVSDYSWISNIMSSCFCSPEMVKEIRLSNAPDEQKYMNLVQSWINWLFSDIVIPLIQAYFYVTERESRRYDVFYYPKSVWTDLSSNAIASLKDRNFKILRGTSRRAIKHLCSSSKVRFVPKSKDMRPVVNLKAQSKDGLLNKCHLLMKMLRNENPEIFGSSVFDYNNVHKNLLQFISSVRNQLNQKNKIYIVVADVSKAFDCINHDMVLKVMDSVLKCDDYVMRKCTKVICKRSKNAIYSFDSNFCISNGDDVGDFSIQLPSGGGILVDQGRSSTIQKKEFLCLLCEQVKRNILKIGQNFYLQKVGIAQGSKLSPNLCSLYYGHLENSVLLNFLHDGKITAGEDASVPNSLLMRFIDDFIFISLSKEHALDFFNRMRRGFVYYNCYMNDHKYGFNFEVGNNERCYNRLYRGDDGFSFIPWSGLLVNCETLEIQADYTRYLDIVISSTITVKKYSSTKYLETKLCHYMRPKCHPIFYDSMINLPRTVRLNLYQAFLLCAMKFHCYVQCMPDFNICGPDILHIIKRTFRYMHSLIIRRFQGVGLQCIVRPVLQLRRKETVWLGLSAYLRVLQKKQSRYTDLLALLTAEIGKCGRLDGNSDSLRYAVEDSHSSMFWKFKF